LAALAASLQDGSLVRAVGDLEGEALLPGWQAQEDLLDAVDA
jgi:hypothetical protein